MNGTTTVKSMRRVSTLVGRLATRRCMSTSKVTPPLSRPTGVNPPFFHQTIVHSDGSSFTIRTTSPRALLKMTKDARNHPLWNPALNVLDDRSGELAKFERRFSDLEELTSLSETDAPVENFGKKKVEKAPEPTPAAAPKKGKKK